MDNGYRFGFAGFLSPFDRPVDTREEIFPERTPWKGTAPMAGISRRRFL